MDEATFEFRYPHRDVSVWPGTSNFTYMISDYTGEINTFLDETSDICGTSDATTKSHTVNKVIGDLLENRLDWLMIVKNMPPVDRGTFPAPSLYDVSHQPQRAMLMKIKEDEKPSVYNFNINTGRVTRWG